MVEVSAKGHCQDCGTDNEPNRIYDNGNELIMEFTCKTCNRNFEAIYDYWGTKYAGKVMW